MLEYSVAGHTGPLDYLVSLIDKRKLELSEVSLRDIAQDFVRYVSEHDIPTEEIASWLRIASRLIYIKTRYVSGVVESAREEDDSAEIITQLHTLKIFKERESSLESMWNPVFLFIDPVLPECANVDAEVHIDATDIRDRCARCISRYKEKTSAPKHIEDAYIAIEAMMQNIAACITSNPVALRALPEAKSRKSMVALFLAVLELLKRRRIVADQDVHHGDIHITHHA